ncbi:MAG: protease complex subunit PrcB family protein [Myxococcales bacterium]|nr:MAG: protease complex subunit PrcB family protein [Myxococcales bacterium]
MWAHVRRRPMKLVNILVGGLAALLIAGCGADEGSSEGVTPETSEEGASDEELVAGKSLPFTVIAATRSNAKKGVTLLRTAAEYKAFFGVKAPAGLFPKSWVVHYAMGTKNTGGYEVEITSVKRGSATGHRLSVGVTTRSPGPQCMVTQALTSPQVAVRIAAQPGVDLAASKLDAQTDLCGGCVDVSDCPKIKMACKTCDDGSQVCPQMTCDAGTCDLINTECPVTGAMCGGFAGFACPAGQTCVDNPSDTCDPENGGADCSGVCLVGEVCGDVICGEGTACCNPLMNLCTKPGMVCAQ